MKRKAQNTVEIVALATLVVAIVFSVVMIYNNKNVDLANLSKIKTVSGVPGSTTGGSDGVDSVFNAIDAETAGALSSILNYTISKQDVVESSNHITAVQLFSIKSSDNQNIFEVANEVIRQLSISVPSLSTTVSDSYSLQNLVNVAIQAKSTPNYSSYPVYQVYLGMLKTLFGPSSATR